MMNYQDEYIRLHPDLHDADLESKITAVFKILPHDININSILDVACGSGKILIEVLKKLNSIRNVGIDISKKAINIAKQYDLEKKVLWITKDIFKFNQERFDLVLALDIIEHISDDKKFLNKMEELGQNLIIKAPIEKNFINKLFNILSFKKIDPLLDTKLRYGHVHHYSLKELMKLINGSSFSIKKINYMHLPKRSKLFWEIWRIIFMPLWFISKEYYIKFNGGFLVLFLTRKET